MEPWTEWGYLQDFVAPHLPVECSTSIGGLFRAHLRAIDMLLTVGTTNWIVTIADNEGLLVAVQQLIQG